MKLLETQASQKLLNDISRLTGECEKECQRIFTVITTCKTSRELVHFTDSEKRLFIVQAQSPTFMCALL